MVATVVVVVAAAAAAAAAFDGVFGYDVGLAVFSS